MQMKLSGARCSDQVLRIFFAALNKLCGFWACQETSPLPLGDSKEYHTAGWAAIAVLVFLRHIKSHRSKQYRHFPENRSGS